MDEILLSLSYLSTKYSTIARVSLYFGQLSEDRDGYQEDIPKNEVIVVVVDNGRDATVGVELHKVWTLLLALLEVEVDGFICQSEFFKDDGNFPEKSTRFQTTVTFRGEGNERTSRWDHPCGCTR